MKNRKAGINQEWRMCNVRLSIALASEHLLRAQAMQHALVDARESHAQSAIERAQHDAEALVKAFEEIRDSLTHALVMGLN